MELFRQSWLSCLIIFAVFQGPLSEELGWLGFLPPRLLDKYSPLWASLILGLLWAAGHIAVFFSPLATIGWFTASATAFSILMTVLFWHARGSVLLAVVMHWSVIPGKDIAGISFPSAPQPPDWLSSPSPLR
jgi:membrane protease YdiL (CAAX protease family)